MWYYAAWKAVNVSYLNILICNRDMLFPAAAAGSWFRQRDQAWPTCLKNYSSQLRGFSWIHVLILWCKPTLWQQWWIITYLWSHLHKVSPLPLWFIGIASICKQARRLPATGAAPWVQCYLLSQPKQGSPQAGTSSHWAHAWFSYLYLSAHGYSAVPAAREGDSFSRAAAFCHRLSHLYSVISCCLTNDWKLQAIMLSVE